MKQLVIFLLLLVCIGTLSYPALAYGARAAAMGGAYTAIADDASAPYWNPAGITEIRLFGFSPSIGFTGTKLDEAKDLLDLETYPPKLPKFELHFQGQAGLTSKHFALNAFADLNANSEVLVEGSSSNGQAQLDLYGVLTTGWKLGERWAVGVNFKSVRSKLSSYQLNLTIPYDPDQNFLADADAKGEALDIGLQYRLNERIKFGFIARNCYYNLKWNGTKQLYNFDETKLGSEEPYEVNKKSLPQNYVLGVAYQPFDNTLLALDIDKTKDDYEDFIRIHLGFEQKLLFNSLTLRLGAYTNEDDPTTLTGGIGLKLGPVLVDAAAVFEKHNEGYYLTAGFIF